MCGWGDGGVCREGRSRCGCGCVRGVGVCVCEGCWCVCGCVGGYVSVCIGGGGSWVCV